MSQLRQVIELEAYSRGRAELIRFYPDVERILQVLRDTIARDPYAYPVVAGTPLRVAKTNGFVKSNGSIIPPIRVFYGLPHRSERDAVVFVNIGTYQQACDDESELIAWSIVDQA